MRIGHACPDHRRRPHRSARQRRGADGCGPALRGGAAARRRAGCARGAARRAQRQHRLARGQRRRQRGPPSPRRSTRSASCRRSCSRRSIPASKAMWRSEVAVLAARAGRARALVAPAIPAQGRSVASGRLSGAGVAAPIDVAAVLAASGLTLEVPDTASDADFDAPWRQRWPGRRCCSSAPPGLRRPLPAGCAPAPGRSRSPRLAPPVLLAIGSHDPITLAQVERLARCRHRDRHRGAGWDLPDRWQRARRSSCGSWRWRRSPSTRSRQAPGSRTGLRNLSRSAASGTLLGCGGETADAILGSLGVRAF